MNPENSFGDIHAKDNLALFIDGAARGNPGPSGIGIYLTQNNTDLIKKGFFIGVKTNNQAEYLALLVGLLYSRKYITAEKHIDIYTDSQLLVRQLLGEYRVKNPMLLKLFRQVQIVLNDLNYKICHIFREKNKQADKLANDGIDKQHDLPDPIKRYLSEKELL